MALFVERRSCLGGSHSGCLQILVHRTQPRDDANTAVEVV